MKQLKEVENYKDVREGYFITTCGKIVSVHKNRMNKNGFLIMKKFKDKDGYNICFPRKEDGKTKTVRVSRALASAYITNPENKKIVDHIDRNKNNDTLINLRWTTPTENNINRFHNPKRKNSKKILVIKDGVVLDKLTGQEIVEKYGVRRTSIYQVLCNKSRAKSVKGYAFKYSECND